MTTLQTFSLFSTIIFLFLGIIWSKDGMANTLIKTMFWAMMIFGVIVTLVQFGFVLANGIRLI